MAHELFGERFGDARQPAWHGLGQVFNKKMSAAKAFDAIGRYEVELKPLTYEFDKKTRIQVPNQAIVRMPTEDSPAPHLLGVVGKDYHLITPDDVVSIYDEQVAKPVETIGVIQEGANLFLTTQLPKIGIRGDEVWFYLLISNWMNGLRSCEVMKTGVRVVCANTLLAAEHMATDKFKIVHDHTAKVRLAEWLRTIYEESETTVQVLKELYTMMASRRVKTPDAQKLFDHSYPVPAKPKTNAPAHVMEQRIKWWEDNVNLMQRRRDGAKMLFEGMGTGMDVPAAKGTLWGAYNAVVEMEDYRKGRSDEQVAVSALFGERALAKRRAFDYCVNVVRS